MNVFISWSGEPSKSIAQVLNDWIPHVIQTAEPFMSPNIDKGDRWDNALDKQLEAANVGIVVLTRSNTTAPWILFEAGALSKIIKSRVCTFLFDLKESEVEYPLAKFQHTIFTKDEVFKLVETIRKDIS